MTSLLRELVCMPNVALGFENDDFPAVAAPAPGPSPGR